MGDVFKRKRKKREREKNRSKKLQGCPITTFYKYKQQKKTLFCERILCAVGERERGLQLVEEKKSKKK